MNRERSMKTFADGDQCKTISADVALVQSCEDCHNQRDAISDNRPRAFRSTGWSNGKSHALVDDSTALGPVILSIAAHLTRVLGS